MPSSQQGNGDLVIIGLLVWFIGSVELTAFMQEHLSAWDFLLVWMASGFIALIGLLIQAVIAKEPEKKTKKKGPTDNQIWKVVIVVLCAFSLCGPFAFIACCLSFAVFFYRAASRRANRVTASA